MKLLLIGHSVLDHLKENEKIKISPGGIFYSVFAINRIKNSADEIFLCTEYDDQTFDFFSFEYNQVKKDYLEKVDSIPKVQLMVSEFSERHETYENITNNLKCPLDEFKQFDGIYINMITGFDISIEQLQKIRSKTSKTIFMDVHTLSRGLSDDYKREFRKIPDFHKWASCIDVLQLNENELPTTSLKTTEKEIVTELLETGIKIVIVTKGSKGASVYQLINNELISTFIAAKPVKTILTIGCGDVFGASFFYSYISINNTVHSLSYAMANTEIFLSHKLKN